MQKENQFFFSFSSESDFSRSENLQILSEISKQSGENVKKDFRSEEIHETIWFII